MTDGHDDPDERFSALARAAREAVFIHENGVVQEINDAFTRLFGYERHEIIGKNGVTALTAPESQPEVERSMRVPGGSGTRVLRSTSGCDSGAVSAVTPFLPMISWRS